MSSNPTVFSGYIRANDGDVSPEPFQGPAGWTVDKSQQTEIYRVTHNLGLTNPQAQFHVVIQAVDYLVLPAVTLQADTFTISAWKSDNGAPMASDLMFIATYYPDAPPLPPGGLKAK